jgi:hypothetical protein
LCKLSLGLGVLALTLVLVAPAPGREEKKPATDETVPVAQHGATQPQAPTPMVALPPSSGQEEKEKATGQVQSKKLPDSKAEKEASPKAGKLAGKGDGVGDPFANAKLALEDLDHRGGQLEKGVAGLMNEIERLRPNDLVGEQRTIKMFKDVLALTQVQGRKIDESENEVQSIARLYREALLKAPHFFRKASKEFERLGKEEKFPELAKYYAEMANQAMRDAEVFEKRLQAFDREIALVTTKVAFVRSTVKLSSVMSQSLEMTPDPVKAAQLGRFIEVLDKYVAGFRTSVQAFGRFHEQRYFSAQPVPPGPHNFHPEVPPGLEPPVPPKGNP